MGKKIEKHFKKGLQKELREKCKHLIESKDFSSTKKAAKQVVKMLRKFCIGKKIIAEFENVLVHWLYCNKMVKRLIIKYTFFSFDSL